MEGSRVGEGGGAGYCEDFVALGPASPCGLRRTGTTEPEVDRIDRIPEFQDWGPERKGTGVSARLIGVVFGEAGEVAAKRRQKRRKRDAGKEPLTVGGSR